MEKKLGLDCLYLHNYSLAIYSQHPLLYCKLFTPYPHTPIPRTWSH